MTQEASSASLVDRFRAAWTTDADPATAVPELLPVRLARACVATLPVDAAGLSLYDHEFRVPLGASDDQATFAERLQFTQGEGPCLEAAASQTPSVLGIDEIRARWPALAEELVDHSPYRGIASLPLRVTPTVNGAVDLYVADQQRLAQLPLQDALTVAGQVIDALAVAQAISGDVSRSGVVRPAWLEGPVASQRVDVWIAMGVVMTVHDLTASDALALLRAYAYGHDQVLDSVAAEVLHGGLDPAELAR